jgi:hypothetical protein
MSDDWAGEGYDAEASSGGGLWLRLKKRGEKVRLRLVSAPCRYTDTFDKDDGTKETRKRAAWLAIHKEIVDGKPSKRVVIFQNGPMVYGILKDLAEDENWGDPTQFDITVERTEESGKYYVVTPLPKPIGPITDDERQLITAAAIDWPAVCNKGKNTETPYARPTKDEEDDPFADE